MRAHSAELHPGASPDPARPLFYARHDGVPTRLSPDTVTRVLAAPAGAHSSVPLPPVVQMLGYESMSTTSAFYSFATQDMMARAIADSAPAVVSEGTGWAAEERKASLHGLR